jgi:hypothetical protein
MPMRRCLVVCAVGALLIPSALARGADEFFVSPNGDDNADGRTPATAWRSVAKVNASTFAPGTQVSFERGGEWRESLSVSSSGTAEAPIVFGAYGSGGARPQLWGSDVLDRSSFAHVAGNTYAASIATPVNALLADHNFLRGAVTNTFSSNPAVNRAFVDATPNSYYYDTDAGKLYVNTGGVNPASDPRLYTAAVRENVIHTNEQDNLVIRDLSLRESAKDNGGYALAVVYSDNVRVENVDARAAGKHHFGVLNSTGFVAKNLHSTVAMPDQAYGSATAYVSYSTRQNSRFADTSEWIDCVAEDMNGPYLGFYTHGDGVGDVLVQNMTVRGGAGIAVATDSPLPQDIRFVGGLLDNADLTLYGNDTVVDGLRITGAKSSIDLRGARNVIQNILMTGAIPDDGYYSALNDQGVGNVIQFNTVLLDPSAPVHATAMALLNASVTTKLRGNIFDSPGGGILRQWFAGAAQIDADFNLYSPDAQVIIQNLWRTLAQWQAMGYDDGTLAALAQFVDPANGDYRLADGSLAIDRIAPGIWGTLPDLDFAGGMRPFGQGYDLGAFETVPEPGTGAAVAALAAISTLAVRCRRRV